MPWEYIGALIVIVFTVVMLWGVYTDLRDLDDYKCPAGDGERDE